MLMSLSYYLLIGFVWSITYTAIFIQQLVKQRQLRPLDLPIITLIFITFTSNFIFWPAGIYYTIQLFWKGV